MDLKGIFNSSHFVVDEKLNKETDRKVIESGETIDFEESIKFKNGEERWYHTTKKPLRDKEGNINVLGISIDITDRKKHSDELIKAKQTKEQFLANVTCVKNEDIDFEVETVELSKPFSWENETVELRAKSSKQRILPGRVRLRQ